jgi:acyl-CoA reductase-like NAD-dependent aldehyde dehydrogenase
MTTTPTRIDDELYESAKVVASLMSRSAAQQLAHWARIGREIEAGASVSQRSIAAALAGRLPYDELTPHEQAVVRAEWAERMDARREDLDVAAEFAAAGKPYVGLDAQGRVVRYAADGTVLGIVAAAAGS